METNQESFQINVETITPIHVGSGRKLMANSEFIIRGVRNKQGEIFKKIGVIDEAKVLSVIGKDRLDDWIKVIERNGDLFKLMKEEKEDVNFKDFSLRTILLKKKEDGSENFLKEHIFTANKPFIPGSSLKGSIRTAILTEILNKRETVIPDEKLLDFKKKISDGKIQDEIFGKDPNNDIFRFIQIGDILFSKSQTVALNVLNLNTTTRGIEYDSSKSVLTECIPAGENASCRIKIAYHHAELARNKAGIDRNYIVPKDLKQLFHTLNSHTIKLIDQEIEIWEDDINFQDVKSYLDELEYIKLQSAGTDDLSCIVRLGHGSGWRFMTGAWPESDLLVSESMQRQIVDAARPNNNRYSEYNFPKSRRMDEQGDLLGFVKLTIKD